MRDFWIIRDFTEILAPAPLTSIFNENLQNGRKQVCYKLAAINPIPKVSKPSEPSHYRPLSLHPLLSKCLERIVAQKWLLQAIQRKNCSTQFAYVPGRGTNASMTLLYNRIFTFLHSESRVVHLLAIDFEKAFDRQIDT